MSCSTPIRTLWDPGNGDCGRLDDDADWRLFMALIKRRSNRPSPPAQRLDPAPIYSAEIDHEFLSLVEISAQLMDKLSCAASLNDDERMQLMTDCFQAGVRWTRLEEGGYFESMAKTFSEALALIVLGQNRNEPDQIDAGLELMKEAAPFLK